MNNHSLEELVSAKARSPTHLLGLLQERILSTYFIKKRGINVPLPMNIVSSCNNQKKSTWWKGDTGNIMTKGLAPRKGITKKKEK